MWQNSLDFLVSLCYTYTMMIEQKKVSMTIEFEGRKISIKKTENESHPMAYSIGYRKEYSFRWNRLVFVEQGPRERHFARIANAWHQVTWNREHQVWLYY
jgi:hypothetical protein